MFPPLLLGGISTGLAIACKWTGVYAALGLAVLFFISFCGKYRKNPAEFKPKMLKTLLFCTLSFVLIPAVIYLLSYIPYVRCTGGGFAAIVQNQIDMLTYHGSTVVSATHTYSSPWYQWAVDYRPIWYYSGENGELSENISSFGNPAVWWTGIFALLFCIADALRNKNKISAFLVIGYLSQLIPWIPVTRITFIYHYFPCVPFIVMMTSHSAHRLYARNRNIKTAFVSLAVLAVILFALFYPSISGYPTDAEFVKKFLTWLPSWHLTN